MTCFGILLGGGGSGGGGVSDSKLSFFLKSIRVK
jgi:hypothetical protein